MNEVENHYYTSNKEVLKQILLNMKTYCLDVLDTVTNILSCSVKKDEI